MPKLTRISLFEPQKKSTKRIAISQRRIRRRISYCQIDSATDLDKKTPICAKNVLKCSKRVTFWTRKKVKQKDSKYERSPLVDQIDCKNTKKKSKLLVKWFGNSFRKTPPISARNVPKLPKISLFEQKKSPKKRIAISKRRRRRRINYSQQRVQKFLFSRSNWLEKHKGKE